MTMRGSREPPHTSKLGATPAPSPLVDECRISLVGNHFRDLIEIRPRGIVTHVGAADRDLSHLDAGRAAQAAVHGADAVLAGHAFDGEMQLLHACPVKRES